MEETTKVKYCKRRKTLFRKRIIISPGELADIEFDRDAAEGRLAELEFELKQVRKSNQIKSKMITGLIHQNLAMKGRLPAPLCPKCGEPKIAGGVQWIDHAECYAGNAKGKS